MTDFVCVNVGKKYPKFYVERLYNMVKRNTTKDFDFYIYTDNLTLYPEKHYKVIEHDTDDIGWWCKLNLFRKGVLPPGEYLYFDLDVVIVDNIDCFFDHSSFAITRDFIRPDNGIIPGKEYNSSALRFNNTRTQGIYDFYSQNKKTWKSYQKQVHFFGDQNVISQYVNHYPDFLNVFPDEWLWSLKKGQERGEHVGDRSQWFGRKIPENGKVCVFHGNPSPQDILDNPKEYEGESFYNSDCKKWLQENYK